MTPGPALDDVQAMRRFHLDAVALQREYPDLLGPRLITNCPHDHQGEPHGTLAAYMRANLRRTT